MIVKLFLFVAVMLLFQATLSPGMEGLIATVAATIAAVVIHLLSRQASRIATAVGVIAGLFGTFASSLSFLPPRIGLPIAIAGAFLMAFNERLHGGLSTVQ
jgi:hypothetical protein